MKLASILTVVAAAFLLPLAHLAAGEVAAVPTPARCFQLRPLMLPAEARVQVQKDGEHGFSRAPKAAYVTLSGVFVEEYLVPPVAARGPWCFMVELSRISADGRRLHTSRYWLWNSEPEGAVPSIGDGAGSWHNVALYETDVPFVFRIRNRVLRFTLGGGKEGDGIQSCDYCDLDKEGRPTSPWRPYYPGSDFRKVRPRGGIFSN